jgi:hypothetical protein
VAVAGGLNRQFGVAELSRATGVMLAQGRLPGAGEARSIAFDGVDGTIVAAGSMRRSPSGNAMTVAKFDDRGAPLWFEAGEDLAGDSAAVSVAVDQETEAVAVGGTLSGAGGSMFTVMLFGPDGSEQWRSVDVPGSVSSIQFAADRVVAAGQVRDGRSTLFGAIAFSRAGTESWRRTFRGATDAGANAATAIGVADALQKIFIVGTVTGSPTGPDMFAIGLDFEGADLPGMPGARSLATGSAAPAPANSPVP